MFLIKLIILWIIINESIYSYEASRPRKSSEQCESPIFRNGLKQFQNRRRLIKFQCDRSYTLIGSLYAACINGKWDQQIPVCAKKGCKLPPKIKNGITILEGNGLLLRLACLENYTAAGVIATFCDGEKWDKSLGTCRETNETIPLKCDFEIDNLCGWNNDDTADYKWKRILTRNIFRRVRTGPQHDHTRKTFYDGHYMLAESINEQIDNRARLISPIYSLNKYDASSSGRKQQNSCFRFYYHMYGATVSTLRVYIKPISIDLDAILAEKKYVLFEMIGNQKNEWKEGIFALNGNEINKAFQVIFEASAGANHLSDIAIDDVALFDGDCPINYHNNTENIFDSWEENIDETKEIFDIQTCRGKCNQVHDEFNNNGLLMVNRKPIMTCDCVPECEDALTCCPDYRSACVKFDDFENDTDNAADKSSGSIFPSLNNSAIGSTTLSLGNKTSGITIRTTPAVTETTRGSNFTIKPTSSSSVKITNLPNGTTKKMDSKKASSFEYDIFKESPIFSTTDPSSRKENNNKRNGNLDKSRTDIGKFPSNDNNNDVGNDDTRDEQSNYEVFTLKSTPTNEARSEWMIVEVSSSEKPLSTWLVIVIGIISIIGFILISIFILKYIRSRYDPADYKKNAELATRNANEEFSEVDYLTFDENIDCRLQTLESNE